MNDPKYNDEIEVLDGLDDILEEEQPKEEKIETFESVEVQPTPDPEPEEVLSVLDEQPSNLNTEKQEESPFTTFVPDSLGDFYTNENESLMQEQPAPQEEVETPTVTETPQMEEIFHFDFEEPAEAKQETADPEPVLPEVETIVEPEVKPIEEEPPVMPQVEETEEPVIPVMPVEEVEPAVVEEKTPETVEPDPVLASFDSVLEPIDIVDSKEPEKTEEVNSFTEPEIAEEEPKIEEKELSKPDSDLEKTDYNINYNFADVFANGGESSAEHQPTIDDAFQFEPSLTALTPEPSKEEVPFKEEPQREDDLGKTVIIEPVEPKPIVEETPQSGSQDKVETKQEVDQKQEEVTPVEGDIKVEKKEKEEKKKMKKEKKKMDGRMIVFIVLIILLLLAFVILLPTILENFAL